MWWYHRSSSPTGPLPKNEKRKKKKERKKEGMKERMEEGKKGRRKEMGQKERATSRENVTGLAFASAPLVLLKLNLNLM